MGSFKLITTLQIYYIYWASYGSFLRENGDTGRSGVLWYVRVRPQVEDAREHDQRRGALRRGSWNSRPNQLFRDQDQRHSGVQQTRQGQVAQLRRRCGGSQGSCWRKVSRPVSGWFPVKCAPELPRSVWLAGSKCKALWRWERGAASTASQAGGVGGLTDCSGLRGWYDSRC